MKDHSTLQSDADISGTVDKDPFTRLIDLSVSFLLVF